MSEQYLLSVQDLHTTFRTDSGEVQAVNGVSFNLNPGEILGIVGESGSGKSVTAYSVMQILADNGKIKSGHILYKGEDLTTWSEKQMSHFRGKCCSIVFQDPMTSLNPVFTIGSQLGEAIRLHTNRRGKQVRERAIEMLELVGINEPEKRIKQYPFELSGGMRQRVMIAMALACEPDILIADEPTTALDVTIQAQILDLLRRLQQKLHTATILVSHDLGVVARAADRVAVMYAGKIVEIGTAEEVYYDPRHPYTWALLRALPALSEAGGALYTIPGMPPTLIDPPPGDAFACRNEFALAIDYKKEPPMFRVSGTHYAATWLLDPRAPKITPPIGGLRHG